MIDLYCERVWAGLWGEPLNLVSNAGFFVAAWASWRFATQTAPTSGGASVLIAFMVLIGLGSALFHTTASAWVRMLDAAPIFAFQSLFLWLYLRLVAGTRRPISVIACGSLLAATVVGAALPHVLNGGMAYLPAAALLLVLGISHHSSGRRHPLTLLGAGVVFSLSLLFRTADMALCQSVPIGSHFLWHLLNAWTLHLAFRGLAANVRTWSA